MDRSMGSEDGSGKFDVKVTVGDKEPIREEATEVKLENDGLLAADVADEKKKLDAMTPVPVNQISEYSSASMEVEVSEIESDEAMGAARVPATESTTGKDDVPESGENEKSAVIEGATNMEPEEDNSSRPTEVLHQSTDPAPIVAFTNKPSSRTEDSAMLSDAVTNEAMQTSRPGHLSQGGNPLVLVALAGICCIFLFVWGRKRRLSAFSSSGVPGRRGNKGMKMHYTQVPHEQPFSRGHEDDDEYCDDFEEDTFVNDRDGWDDWESNSTQTQLNPFASAPSTPRRSIAEPVSDIRPFTLNQLLSPPRQQHVPKVRESAIADISDSPLESVESNSSSDSFEVVMEEEHMAPASSRSSAASTERESKSAPDDLFSQFNMVPTFQKTAAVGPLPADTSAALVFQSGTAAGITSMSSLPTAAEASALFAAEMDDEVITVGASDEWGEDDGWAKGI
uniref:Uncharacterized protein n=1 Tax=Peronospora matthiolae TaxID=2874970 RepID=A0AAV1U5J9_9STRA